MRSVPDDPWGGLWPEARRALELVDTDEERRRVVDALKREGLGPKPGILAGCLAGIMGFLVIPLCLRACGLPVAVLSFEWRSVLVALGGCWLTDFAVMLVCARLKRRRLNLALRQQLNELGIPVCLHCGYCVRGVASPTCPECGDERLGFTRHDERMDQHEHAGGRQAPTRAEDRAESRD